MFKRIGALFLAGLLFIQPAYAVLPNVFATQPTGNVAASTLDTNFTFLESQGVQALTTTGSSNAYIATPADAWVTGYSSYKGRALTVVPNFTNSGASTINVSGLGTASISKNVGGVATALASGDMVSAIPAILISDGTNFLLANPSSNSSIQTVKSQVITATGSSTYTPCTGLLYGDYELWGAGGGGGGSTVNQGTGGGGGAGGYSRKIISGATIGASQTVVIGTGGTAGAAAAGTGGTGVTSTLGAILSVTGGVGGTGNAGTASPPGAGGVGSGGDINTTGATGGATIWGGNLANASSSGGNSSRGGAGSVTGSQQVGANAVANSGSGASGAISSGGAETGGVGGSGFFSATEYCSQ